MHDGAGVDTGFTMIQPSTSDGTYYVPSNLAVVGGKLNVTATKGIAYLLNGPTGNDVTKNQQDNTLGVGLTPAGKRVRLTTTLNFPANGSDSAQGGLWFGANDNNYVKVDVLASSATVREVQIAREVNGAANSGSAADQVNKAVTLPAGGAITLFLEIFNNTAIGSYQLGTGPVVSIGTLNIPANFSDGTLVTGDSGAKSFGGIYTTKRNMAEATNVQFSFDRFAVTEVDTTAPGARGERRLSAATPSDATLTWTAPADADVASYRVYRSLTANPAPIAAANLVAEVPASSTTYTDGAVFVGQQWNHSVVAVDASGNVSVPAISSVAIPRPAGTPVALVDFTTAAAEPAAGYTQRFRSRIRRRKGMDHTG